MTLSELNQLQRRAVATADYAALNELYTSLWYQKLSYLEKNRDVITSHRLQDFSRCGFCYEMKWLKGESDPSEEESDALLLGTALDDLLTYGQDFFSKKYTIAKTRTATLKKVGPVLNFTQANLLELMRKEFRENKLFNPDLLKKHIVLSKFKDHILKVELDGIDFNNAIMVDLKSTADIVTFYRNAARSSNAKYSRDYYLYQMAFYALILDIVFGIRFSALLYVVDKNKFKPRSGAWYFSADELQGMRGRIMEELEEYDLQHRAGMFTPAQDQLTLYECPYYGYHNHGRPNTYF